MSKRFPHYLKANSQQERPSNAIFVDTETRSKRLDDKRTEAVLWFGFGCYTRRLKDGKWSAGDWLKFSKAGQFWDWVEMQARPKTKLYIYAHNLGFDGLVLRIFGEMEARGYTITRLILDDPPTSITFRKDKITIQVVDTLNHYRMPLEQLGDEMGIAKLDMPEQTAPKAEWDEYCKRDVEVIRQAMLVWWDMVYQGDLGNYQVTIASQAMTAFRHRFMPVPVFIDANVEALELARACYKGARTECFWLGESEDRYYTVDVNSMYPWVMRDAELPYKLIGHYRRFGVDDLGRLLEDYSMCAEVEIDTDEPAYPFHYDGKLIFPVGRFTAFLTSKEVEYALSKNHIREVRQVALYDRAILFKEYVGYFYNLRQDYNDRGNKAFGFVCKIMLNSLYGKWGQNGRKWEEYERAEFSRFGVWDYFDATNDESYRFRQIGRIIQRLEKDGESRESHPAIAAHITANARLFLWELINRAGRANVLYCDTDSLIVTQKGLDRLAGYMDEKTLGKLKLEGTADYLSIRGLKDYKFGDKQRIKGVKRKAIEIAPGVYEQDQFRGFTGWLASGDVERVVITRVQKHMKRNYSKGILTESGWIRPLRLPIEEQFELVSASYLHPSER